jgi:hypothetical protein
LTDGQKKAFPVLLDLLREGFAENSGNFSLVLAHRQGSASREADPGEEIWEEVGLVWQEELGVSDGGEGYHTGDGKGIPREWDPRRKSRYWG